jgi:glutamyl-tRNA(Gln) amidotransferase subunit E
MKLPDPKDIGLKVGLEVHQQLATGRKLFCSCPVIKSEDFPYIIKRRLRPAQSELGHIDPAAIFEFLKGKVNVYKWNPESSCLVEADEEPPHLPDEKAIETSILIALMLKSEVVDEIHVMRKIVIDGSNTSGFQRTAVIALGGYIEVSGKKIGVQSITLEEDAARILGEDDKARYFALDRLGVPLVEISLEPLTASPKEIQDVALALGRTLRSTGRVARGLGTIRQDLNISICGGSIVEVKGVQKLELISKVVEYEMKRQHGLVLLTEELEKRGLSSADLSWCELPKEDVQYLPEVIRQEIKRGYELICIRVKGFAGIFGYEPYPGIRLGKELAEVARANSIGGIIHSDEFERLGLEKSFISKLYSDAEAEKEDALVIFSCQKERMKSILDALISRIKYSTKGVPPETRGPNSEGETRYMRPRPGAERMYPETDIPEIVITKKRLEEISSYIPKHWSETVQSVASRYGVSVEVSLRLFDEDKLSLFSRIVERTGLSGPYVASVLTDINSWVIREGAEESRLTDDVFSETLELVAEGKIAKEAVPEILLSVGKGKVSSPKDAIKLLGIQPISEEELRELIKRKISQMNDLVSQRGERAFSVLMGEIMKETRGRVDGAVVSRILKETLRNKVSE